MLNALKSQLENGRFTVVESFVLPPREERTRHIPKFLFDSRIGLFLHRTFGNLWNHQSLALERVGEGSNVVVSTGTASGKSLIFRSAALHRVLLSETDRVVVFYPLKALAADQLRGWKKLVSDLQLPDTLVGRIDGSVHASEREAILQSSRIIVMTPDVFQAWLMARLAMPAVKEFVANISMIIMDEAHTLEGVFGSNFAFLLRRFLSARSLLKKVQSEGARAVQLVASTATISNPAQHLHLLTGQDFAHIGESDDGSPRHEMIVAHVAAPPGDEFSVAKAIQTELLTSGKDGGFITFVDSRKGVESLAANSQPELGELVGDGSVMPYRAGYDTKDREAIESRLQSGALRGVVSTSALELGIDLPHLVAGINVRAPASRKAYRQRLGRVGRSSPGAFIVIGELAEFQRFGTTLRQYHDASVEPSYLYLDNRFMQFAHARCLVDELEALGASSSLPTNVSWPSGFSEVFPAAKPGGDRPAEFDAIAQLGGDAPQRNYPLRNIGEINFKIAIGESAEPLGDATETQALRECYPGGTYLHLTRAYEVVSWHTNAFTPYIKVKSCSPARRTQPRIKTWINAGTFGADICERHFLASDRGFIAECQMQITERVEGYTDRKSGVFHSYQELRQRNPNLKPRMRNFRTTGVLLCVHEDWFKKDKALVADRLAEIVAREYSISPRDMGSAATNISVRRAKDTGLRGDVIVVFDQTYGSLRLTERLFLQFPHILNRMSIAASSVRDEQHQSYEATIENLRLVYESFSSNESHDQGDGPLVGGGYLQVFVPGSRVCNRERGKVASEVTIVQATMMNCVLMYQVDEPPKYPSSKPAKRWVAAETVEPSAEGDWSYGWWNTETQEYEDLPLDHGLTSKSSSNPIP